MAPSDPVSSNTAAAQVLELPSSDALDFDVFHTEELPKRLAEGNGALAASIGSTASSFAWRLTDGRAFTYVLDDQTPGVEVRPGIEARPGVEADLVVEVNPQDWSDYATELRTWVGLLYTNAAVLVRGDYGLFEDFEPVLLAMYHGRPLYQGWTPTVDITRSFTPDDDPAEMSQFFVEAGFIHIQGVFSAEEVDALRSEVERQRSLATPDDHRSWWATNADGDEVCCRVTYMNDRSELVESLSDDSRLDEIAALAGADLTCYPDRGDGISVVIKLPDIVEGLADLPWHRDCGTGGHSITCPTVNIGIQLDECNEANGQIHFLGGSWGSSSRSRQVRNDWPTVAINAQPGDVTAHFGHTMHAAPPPTSAPSSGGRRTVYVGYQLPVWAEYIPPGKSYNDMLFRDGGRIRSPEEFQEAQSDR